MRHPLPDAVPQARERPTLSQIPIVSNRLMGAPPTACPRQAPA